MKAVKMLLGLALVFAVATFAIAKEEGEKAGKKQTIKGTITCAKCDLKLAKQCHTVIKDADGTVYWFAKDSKGYKENHKKICQGAMEGTVTGVVTTKDGKKWIKTSKVEFKE